MFSWLKKHKVIRTIIAGIGIVLFWRGVWGLADMTPVLSNEFISVGAGVLLLVVSGLLMKEL